VFGFVLLTISIISALEIDIFERKPEDPTPTLVSSVSVGEIPTDPTATSSPEIQSSATPTLLPTNPPSPTSPPIQVTVQTPTSEPVNVTSFNASEIPPEWAVRNYYDLINARRYEEAWSILSVNFKNNEHRNADGSYNFDEYTGWWDRVAQVTVLEAVTIQQSDSYATVEAYIRYLMRDGSTDDDHGFYIQLEWDSTKQAWLFFDTWH
jgi:serine/threonine-protein kinase